MNNFNSILPPEENNYMTNLHENYNQSSFEDEENNSINQLDYDNLIINDKDKKNPDYLCPICKSFLIPDTCIEMKCGHLFCKNCLETMNNNSLVICTNCPLCNEKTTSFKFIKNSNKFAYKILCGVKIYCPNKDCTEELLAGNLNDHIAKCNFEIVNCKYCDKKNIYKKDLKTHMVENMDSHFLKLIDEVEDLKKQINKKLI